MIEVKCNGRVYLFPEDSGIMDDLDMLAKEVRDDPDFRNTPAVAPFNARNAAIAGLRVVCRYKADGKPDAIQSWHPEFSHLVRDMAEAMRKDATAET